MPFYKLEMISFFIKLKFNHLFKSNMPKLKDNYKNYFNNLMVGVLSKQIINILNLFNSNKSMIDFSNTFITSNNLKTK